uniref:40S ribosomal protein S16 n=1 Tax=Parascaris univalens TaxID=6257 RepID=A0A915AJJ0_PARUN
MFDLLSDDVRRRIYGHLEVKERGRLASVNRSFRRLFQTWDDVLYCSARNDGVSLAVENFVFEVDKSGNISSLVNIFACCISRCPWIRKLAIHDACVLADIDTKLIRHMINVDELHIPSNLFKNSSSTDEMIKAILSLPKLRILHIQQRYCEEKSHTNIFHSHHAQSITSRSILNIKLQGVTVTSAALEVLSLKYARTVEILCLIGSLMHTHDINIYFNALNRFEKLLSLTIPPSLYSVSTTNKTLFTTNYPSLRGLHSLRNVAAFVSRPDFDELKRFLGIVLPTNLEHLILFDESCRLSMNVEDEFNGRKPTIHFCDDEEIIVDTFWTNDKSELITRSLWKPPYKPYTVFQPTLPEWYCLISELMDEASSIEQIDHETSFPSVLPNSNTADAMTAIVTDDRAHTQNVFDVIAKTSLNTAHELESKMENSNATNEIRTARSAINATSTTISDEHRGTCSSVV